MRRLDVGADLRAFVSEATGMPGCPHRSLRAGASRDAEDEPLAAGQRYRSPCLQGIRTGASPSFVVIVTTDPRPPPHPNATTRICQLQRWHQIVLFSTRCLLTGCGLLLTGCGLFCIAPNRSSSARRLARTSARTSPTWRGLSSSWWTSRWDTPLISSLKGARADHASVTIHELPLRVPNASTK